jgi:hypothetical protein
VLSRPLRRPTRYRPRRRRRSRQSSSQRQSSRFGVETSSDIVDETATAPTAGFGRQPPKVATSPARRRSAPPIVISNDWQDVLQRWKTASIHASARDTVASPADTCPSTVPHRCESNSRTEQAGPGGARQLSAVAHDDGGRGSTARAAYCTCSRRYSSCSTCIPPAAVKIERRRFAGRIWQIRRIADFANLQSAAVCLRNSPRNQTADSPLPSAASDLRHIAGPGTFWKPAPRPLPPVRY